MNIEAMKGYTDTAPVEPRRDRGWVALGWTGVFLFWPVAIVAIVVLLKRGARRTAAFWMIGTMATILAVSVVIAFSGTTAEASSGLRYCDRSSTGWTIEANSVTSCAFATATYRSARKYQRWTGGIAYGERFRVDAWSSVRHRWYEMRCAASWYRDSLRCRGGVGALVVISR